MYEHDGVSDIRPVHLFKQVLFIAIQMTSLLVFVVGWSWTAVGMCLALYVIRMFGITGAFHRYFSHRTYKTSRWFQFVLALIGTSSAQKGPIWWASHHRHHHQHSDEPPDMHSKYLYGFFWSHLGWILSSQYATTRYQLVRDLVQYPELKWLDEYHYVPPLALAGLMFFVGMFLESYAPSLGTNGPQLLVWVFVSTTLLYHGTFLINSAAHMWGSRRFNTGDESKNSFLLSLITLGEGWHNNHHRYPGSERNGFYWWEIDITHYILVVLSWFGLVWDLREPPARIFDEAKGIGNAT